MQLIFSKTVTFTKTWAGPAAVALFINIVLFGIIPILIQSNPNQVAKEDLISMVNVIRITRTDTPVQKKHRLEPPKPIKQQTTVKKAVMTRQPVKTLSCPFELNPKLPDFAGAVKLPPMEKFGVPDLKTVFEIGEIDGPITPLVQMPPLYPMHAKRQGIEGYVIVRYIVNPQGQVGKCDIIAAEPKGVFENSVRRAVTSWRFSPGTVDGEAVAVWIEQKLNFELE